MEAVDSQKTKKVRKYSIVGLIVGGLLILSTLGSLRIVLRNPELPRSALFINLLPTVAILVRSFRPPMGFGRGLATVIGGMFAGIIPLSLLHVTGDQLVVNLIIGAVGIFLLWIGFKKPKTTSDRKQEIPQEAGDTTGINPN